MNNFRVPGEFEPQSSVLTTWPIDKWATPTMDVDRVSTEIVSAIISEVEVIISSYDDDDENRAKESLQKAGINIDSIHFIRYPCEIPYPRDFGAEVLTDDKGNYKILILISTHMGTIVQKTTFPFVFKNTANFIQTF